MTSINPGDNYILKRDFTASIRLNCQHYIWHQELGYNIHPTIPLSSSSFNENHTLCIAEIATGTGAWLLEVSRSHPNATCHGYDISLAQTPPAIWLPPNVSFTQWDMLSPPAADRIGTYDMVHIRLVNLVITTRDEAVRTMKNLAALLKPNGHIQWDEIDLTDTIVAHASGDSGEVNAVIEMDKLMKSHPSSSAWISNLPDLMAENGFEDVKSWRIKPDMRWVKFYTDCHTLAFKEMADKMVEGDERKVFFERVVRDVGDETGKGAVHGVAKVVCVGRKSKEG